MTVATQITKRIHPGNDAATVFGFNPLTIYESTNLVVVHTTAAGIETTISEGTGPSAYAVVMDVGYPGTGSIRYPEDAITPLPAGETITIKRVLTIEQATDLENQGGYHSETHEVQFDKFVMIDLQQQEELDRVFKFPVSYSGSIDVETDTPTAGTYLRINAAGTAMEWATLTVTTVAAYDTVPEDVDLTVGGPGVVDDYARGDHKHLLPTVTVAKGGTGATDATTALSNLGVVLGVGDTEVPQMDAVGYPAADGSQITSIALTVQDFISELELSNNVTDVLKDVDIAAGKATDEDETVVMALATGITKQLDAAWTVGTNQGGLDTGTISADKWYHAWLIRRSDTGVVDVIFSKEGRLGPVMPTNYDQKRRIGAVLTDSTPDIMLFYQTDGRVDWNERLNEVDGTSGFNVAQTLDVTVPIGHELPVHMSGYFGDTSEAYAYISSPNIATPAATALNSDFGVSAAATRHMNSKTIYTNIKGQVSIRADTNNVDRFALSTIGYTDPRVKMQQGIQLGYAGTTEEDAGTGTYAWVDETNAQGETDVVYATSTAGGTGESRYLKATNFGFAIPTTATILGIGVIVVQDEQTASVTNSKARIVKGGVVSSDATNDISDGLGLQPVQQPYGSETDLWGDTWTPAEINASDFGFATSFGFAATSDKVGVDSIHITVYYE